MEDVKMERRHPASALIKGAGVENLSVTSSQENSFSLV